MNRIKKAAFGILVAGLAFGFSAFTTLKRQSIFVYYKTGSDAFPSPGDPRGYQYFSEDRCEPGGSLCSAQWDIGSNQSPSDGEPLPDEDITFQTGSTSAGHFEW